MRVLDRNVFHEMLTYKRPHQSESLEEFVMRFLDPVANFGRDGFGNLYTRVGVSNTLFSAHLDTVHDTSGRQEVNFDAETTAFSLYSDSNCLGADDAAGVWLMLNMIVYSVPGLYIFHQGEERGCLGSKWIAGNERGLLVGVERAIAFDRRGTGDVITWMHGRKCCSEEFGNALAHELALGHTLTDGFSTDTGVYTELIPECTNVSVGYQDEHRATETANFSYLEALLNSVCDMNFESLPTHRVQDRAAKKASKGTSIDEAEWNNFLNQFLYAQQNEKSRIDLKGRFAKLLQLRNPYAESARKLFQKWAD